jgi:hypothetical protein
MAMIRLKSDSQGQDSFILYLAPSAIDYRRLRRSRSTFEAVVERFVSNALPNAPWQYRERPVESVLCIQA